MDDKIEAIDRYIKQSLSKERYRHILGVKAEAFKLCRLYGISSNDGVLAALLHDVAKEFSLSVKKDLCKTYNIAYSEFESYPQVLHGVIGAEIARDKFGIENQDIINAIKYHTTGRPNMSLLEKIIFISDYIEEGRPSLEGIMAAREVVNGQIDQAIIISLEATIDYLIKQKKKIHPLTLETLEYYKEDSHG